MDPDLIKLLFCVALSMLVVGWVLRGLWLAEQVWWLGNIHSLRLSARLREAPFLFWFLTSTPLLFSFGFMGAALQEVAVSTAARSGAIFELTWDRIDLEKGLVDFGEGHGNKRRSVVPINDELLEALLTAKELRQSKYVVEFNGKPVKRIKKAFRQLCLDLGLKGSPHTLRHSLVPCRDEAVGDFGLHLATFFD